MPISIVFGADSARGERPIMPDDPPPGSIGLALGVLTVAPEARKLQNMPRAYSPKILGVLNLSPESMVRESIATTPGEIETRARRLVAAGADWIDLGGRSITPDVPMIDDETERERLLPAIDLLRSGDRPLSVDTWSDSTARAGLEAGAGALNFTGRTIERETLDVIADKMALLFLTFMPYSNAYAMRNAAPADVGIDAILDHLGPKVDAARSAGVAEVVIDPNLGIIHPSTDDETKIHRQLEIVWNLEALRILECPILLYAARKPERLARIMMASAIVHAKADYIRTHTPEMIETLLHVNA
jgi:dihydropteroate synthase